MSTCTPLEHDYIGLSEVSSMPPMTSPKLPSPLPPLDIKETELRLGLPGTHFLEKKTHRLPPSGVSAFGLDSEDTLLGISLNPGRNPTSGAKRGFFDAIDGCYAKVGGAGVVKSQGGVPKAVRKDIVIASDERSEWELEKKEEEDQVSEHVSAASASKAQVVGWPPIRSFRKKTMASTLPKSSEDVEGKSGAAGCLYLKVSMDGAPYLRKVDLKNYKTYVELSAALEGMFSCFNIASGNCVSNEPLGGEISWERQLADLLNGSEFVLTYEDKDGDWMLVGDVPWRMFADSCRRLRIMKGSDAIGLAPVRGEVQEGRLKGVWVKNEHVLEKGIHPEGFGPKMLFIFHACCFFLFLLFFFLKH